nr:GTP cyclohydrolase [Epilithonimonas hungarica]
MDQCYEKKKFVASGRIGSPAQGFIIAYNCSRIELEHLLQEDPLAVHDVVEYNITEYNPTKYAAEFEQFIK